MPTTLNPFQNVSNTTYSGNGLGASPAYVVSSSRGSNLNAGWTNSSVAAQFEPGGVLSLNGEKADILVNGISLTNILQTINDRLNILQPNPALEAEWDELRELGQQYRKLEADLLEKQRMWEILKKENG